MPILNRTFRRGGISQYDLAMHIYIYIYIHTCAPVLETNRTLWDTGFQDARTLTHLR